MRWKLALPKGWIQGHTAAFLQRAGFEYTDYNERSRSYRPVSRKFPALFTKVLQEKDIAIQVATGNYDLAICGFDWIQELLVKYHRDAIVKVRDLGYGGRQLFVCASRFSGLRSMADVRSMPGPVRIVSEYPNLAEAFALRLRLPYFRIFPVWGATEAYPPEHADLAIVSAVSDEGLAKRDLIPIARIISGNAWLIANRDSLEHKDMSAILEPFYRTETGEVEEEGLSIDEMDPEAKPEPSLSMDDEVGLALADGHQQSHTLKFLMECGLRFGGYDPSLRTRRPVADLPGVAVKVIRPQDMPLQVANGNFDLAITGRDWLNDQLYQFPSSPVAELLDLGFGRVRIVAVAHRDLPAKNTEELGEMMRAGGLPVLRIATEYTNIADKYARDNHLSPYRVIPSWGATEAFLPEDADVLIENTETGETLRKNNLKIIETLFESTGCLIGNTRSLAVPAKRERIDRLVRVFKQALSAR